MNELMVGCYRIAALSLLAFAMALATTGIVLRVKDKLTAHRRNIETPEEAMSDVWAFRAWIMARSLLPKTVWMCLTESEFEKFREYVLNYWSTPGRSITETELKTWAHRFVEKKRRLCCQ